LSGQLLAMDIIYWDGIDMTKEEFTNHFYELVCDLEENGIKDTPIDSEVIKIDDLCRRYLRARAKQIGGHKKNNILDNSD